MRSTKRWKNGDLYVFADSFAEAMGAFERGETFRFADHTNILVPSGEQRVVVFAIEKAVTS